MSSEELVQYLIYALLGFIGWVVQRQWVKVETLKDKVNKVEVELAKQKQENSELYNNIRRIDTNIDKLFDKIDTLLDLVKTKK
jgi:peptidoglycan hydrolase CwlO-like protein